MAPGFIRRNISGLAAFIQAEAEEVRAVGDIAMVICYTASLTSGPAASAGAGSGLSTVPHFRQSGNNQGSAMAADQTLARQPLETKPPRVLRL